MATNDTGLALTDEEVHKILTRSLDGTDTLKLFVSNIDRTQATLNRTCYDGRKNIELLHILVQAVHCPVNRGDVISLLSIVKDSKFYKEGLGLMLGAINLSDDDLNIFFKIIKECVAFIDLLCTKLSSTLEETSTLGLIGLLKAKIEELLPDSDENMRGNISETSETVSRLQDDIMKRVLRHGSFKQEVSQGDFRKISILPREEDIAVSRIILQPNKKKGGYENLQHYLDVQFRLYREDCISPLRDGIVEYVREHSAGRYVGRLQDGRLYKDVVASDPWYSMEGLSVTITIDKHHSSRIKWRTNHRLLYGSLVCLSPDHFQTMFFAVVSESDRDILQAHGTFKVQFATGTKDSKCPLNLKLTMVESTAYYESYRHVLTSLQNIEDEDLPFQKYIVYCKKDIDPPKYLMEIESPVYDFQPIVSNDVLCKLQNIRSSSRRLGSLRRYGYEQVEVRTIEVFSPVPNWPSPDELHLDTTQFKAFHSALTEEFVLIQGPPGTGKTYVGLQIAKTLLHNKHIWRERIKHRFDEDLFHDDYNYYSAEKQEKLESKCPMLIVCFTNHALDQFMEGIINFHDKHNKTWRNSIVRVGGRGESKVVDEFALKNRRRRYRHHVDERSYMDEEQKIQYRIAFIRWSLHKTRTVILCPNLLEEVIDSRHYEHLYTKAKANKKEHEEERIAEWLAATKQHWIRRATLSYSEGIKTGNDNEKEKSNDNETVDVETEAQKAEYDRRIEEDEIVTEFNENIGLDVNSLLQKILSEYEFKDIDEKFKNLIESEAKNVIKQLSSTDKMSDEEVEKLGDDIQKLQFEDRWSLYRHWLNKYRIKCKQELETLKELHKSIFKHYQREKQETDARILKEATVIAMTTTGAARYQDVLREIGPRVIIVEEAAEVLEAHIVATLSSKCEHLILIGDHKQLEPKPTVHQLAIRYNIGISMFERMINNELSYHCLQRQHRMRPEISTLVRHIYPTLIDNENVQCYDHVQGVKKDVFFISHKQPEQYRDDIRSYSNEHEARYIMRLCRYLMLQGYDAKQITVLAAYNGQMFTIRDLMPKSEFYGVRVCAVDNYQGEENDIVLLSLVRSNEIGNIGFLKRENRICVALSRAKMGMYVIGNFSILGKGSPLWKKVLNEILKLEGISQSLPLYCQNHPITTIMARIPEDFDKAPQGGCVINCDFRLPCGHSCRFKCHPIDKEHRNYRCKQKCHQVCINGHICQKICHYGEDCNCKMTMEKTLSCKHKMKMQCRENPENKQCPVLVQRILERCGHKIQMECYIDPKKFLCNVIVEKTLPCEHQADIYCYVDPAQHRCMKMILQTRSCGHKYELACYMSKEIYELRNKCKEVVKRQRACGHSYSLSCSRDQILYEMSHECKEITRKTFTSCGHAIDIACHKEVDEMSCLNVISKQLDCGHEVKIECCRKDDAICTYRCLKACDNKHICEKPCHYGTPCVCKKAVKKVIPSCGHEQTMPCHINPFLEICRAKVSKILPKCQHEFVMDCGGDSSLVECKKMVSKVVPFCGHNNDMLCYSDPADFCQCDKIVCKVLLCGHLKNMTCSSSVRAAKCRQKVFKTLPNCKHEAQMFCSDNNFNAVKCEKIVTKSLPNCGHTKDVPCFRDVNTVSCEEKISITLPCGHNYEMTCSDYDQKSESVICREKVTKTLPCKHKITVDCCSSENVSCDLQCGANLFCGHSCSGNCGSCFQSMSHPPCDKYCGKKLVCGHDCPSSTCGSCSPCQQICSSCCPHIKLQHGCGTPCKPCHEPCTWVCTHKRCTKVCDEPCDRSRCEKRCAKKLKCMHQCLGFCGEPCPDICRECTPEEVTKIVADGCLFKDKGIFVTLQECGHVFPAEKLDKHFEDLSKNNAYVILCPFASCQCIIRWHPRYGHILRNSRRIQNKIKTKLSSFYDTTENIRSFPVVRRNFENIINYCKQCKTILFLMNTMSGSDNILADEHKTTTDLASKMITFLGNLPQENLCEQTLHDVFKVTYEIATRWMVFIVRHLLTEDYDSSIRFIDSGQQETPVMLNDHYRKYRLNAWFVRKATDVLKNSSEFTLQLLHNIQTILSPHFDNVEYMAIATKYPVFEGVVNVHSQDWKLCGKDHLQPSSCHRKCFQCELGREPDLEVFMKDAKFGYEAKKQSDENPSLRKSDAQEDARIKDQETKGRRRYKQNQKSKSRHDNAFDNEERSLDLSKMEPLDQGRGFERSPEVWQSGVLFMDTRTQYSGQRGGGLGWRGYQGGSRVLEIHGRLHTGSGRRGGFRGGKRGRGRQEDNERGNRRDDSRDEFRQEEHQSGGDQSDASRGRGRHRGQQRGRNRRRRSGRRN